MTQAQITAGAADHRRAMAAVEAAVTAVKEVADLNHNQQAHRGKRRKHYEQTRVIGNPGAVPGTSDAGRIKQEG